MAYGQENDFVINKGFDNEFLVTIKQNKTMLPMVIDDSDVFEFYLFKHEDNILIAKITSIEDANGSIVFTDKDNGEITIKIKKELADTLTGSKGTYADRYYLKPKHYGLIDAVTLNNGNFISRIEEIFVD
jgi:5S rRNA maturation endonuclease (ribonuclease M5)